MPKKFKTKIKREVAIKKLQGFMDRACLWNTRNYSSWHVSDVVLLGSLSRGEDKVGDIDLCMRIRKNSKEHVIEDIDEYLLWREEHLGYAYPRQLYSVMTDDLERYVTNSDGRIEILGWDQKDIINLTMNPYIYLMKDRILQFKDVRTALKSAAPITLMKAKEIIDGEGVFDFKKFNPYVNDYYKTLSVYPREIREMIFSRDGSAKAYEEYLLPDNK